MLGAHIPHTETAREAVAVTSGRSYPYPSHHDACLHGQPDGLVSTSLLITVGHREDGSLCTTIRFASGDVLVADAGSPDLGFDEAHNVLHDVAHTVLACALGLRRSPVLERVVDLRPLSQEHVDLEEAAVFALQAWTQALRGETYGAAVSNALASLNRLDP